ncbi:hypothetical protein Tco_1320141, partial [Tanacetum coccineum]
IKEDEQKEFVEKDGSGGETAHKDSAVTKIKIAELLVTDKDGPSCRPRGAVALPRFGVDSVNILELKDAITEVPLDDVCSVPTAIMPLDICHVKCTTPSRDQTNSYVSDGDKVQEDRQDPPGLIALKGCSSSEAYQLLNNRWAATMSAYENPSTDLSEKPVMYSGSGGTEVEGSSHQIDFLSELRRAMNH